MNYLGVDLAAKFSAAVVVNERGKVLFEMDSWGVPPIDFVEKCVQVSQEYSVELTLVEDLPYGLSKQFQTKPATRLQGIMIKTYHDVGLVDDLWFVNPVVWQKEFEVHRSGAEGARAAAQRLGFDQRLPIEMYADSIPPLGKEHAKKRAAARAQLKKASTDYDDGFLIAFWAALESKRGTIFDHKGVQKYEG